MKKIVKGSLAIVAMYIVLIALALPAQAKDQLTILELPNVNDNEKVKFEDVNLETLVKERYPNEDILIKHIKKMYSFKGVGFTSFVGLEHAYNMTMFEATDGEINDLSPLKNWQSLYDLNLTNNKLTSLAALAETGKTVRQTVYRQKINVANNKLTDLSPLKTWDFLKHLDVSNNALQNISLLKEFKHLEYLNIKGNPLTREDIEVLRDLVRSGVQVETDEVLDSAEDVFFYSKELETVIRKQLRITGPITREHLLHLTTLDVSHTAITDLRGLEYAVNLTSLNISYTKVVDIKILILLQKLEKLSLAGTPVTNLAWLSQLPNVKEIDASYVQINGEFPEIKTLEKLNLSYARYDRLAVFTKKRYPNLQELNVIGAYYPESEQHYVIALEKEGVIVRYSEVRKLQQRDTKLYISLDSKERIKEITRVQLYSKDIQTLYGSKYASYDFSNLVVQTDSAGRAYVVLPMIALAEDYTISLSIGTTIRVEQIINLSKTEASIVITTPRQIKGIVVNAANEPLINHAILTPEGTIYTNVRGEFTYVTYLDAISLYTMVGDIKLRITTLDFTTGTYDKIVNLGVFQVKQSTGQGTERIHGTIVDVNGKQLANGQVRVETKGGVFVGNAIIDRNGYFSIDGLAKGEYRLYVKDVTGLIIYQVLIVHTNSNQQHMIVQVVTAGAWYGEGNRFMSNKQSITPGNYVSAQLRYRNNSAQLLTNVRIKLTATVSLTVMKKYALLNGKEVKWIDDRTIEIGQLLPGESGKLSLTSLVEEDHHKEDLSLKATLTSAEGEEQSFINEYKKVRVTLEAPEVVTKREIKIRGLALPDAKVTILVDGKAVGETKANSKWWTATITTAASANESIEVQARVDSGGRTYYSDKQKITYQPTIPKITDAKVTVARYATPINPYADIATSSIIILPGYRKPAQDMGFDVTFDKEVSAVTLHFLNKTYALTREGTTHRYKGEIEGYWEEYSEQTIEVSYRADGETHRLPLLAITPIIDPSGYVFEGSMENKLPGVRASIEERVGSNWLTWNASRFAQVNPLFTDEEGHYGWDVPKGDWRVRFSKDGYRPYTSRTVPVPPPELELNVPLIATTPLQVEVEKVGNDQIYLRFNRPVKEHELTSAIAIVDETTGNRVTGTFTLQQWAGYQETTAGTFEEDKTVSLSKDVKFTITNPSTTATDYTVTVDKRVTDYRGEKLGVTKRLSTGRKTIAPKHVLKVSFSNDFDVANARTAVTVYNAQGVKVPVRYEKVGHTLQLHPPAAGYTQGVYQLHIASGFTGATGQATAYDQVFELLVQ